jgi:hypothetical protein
MMTNRLKDQNRALYSSSYHFMRTKSDKGVDARIFTQIKWSEDGNVVFVLHNLWEQSVAQSFTIPRDIAEAILLRDNLSYKLVDVMTETQVGNCHTGKELRENFYVEMDAYTRFQWLRLETCN